jgi:hypothetical protein
MVSMHFTNKIATIKVRPGSGPGGEGSGSGKRFESARILCIAVRTLLFPLLKPTYINNPSRPVLRFRAGFFGFGFDLTAKLRIRIRIRQ